MKDLEKVGIMLKQFIENSMVEANKLDEKLAEKIKEKEVKQKEIEEIQQQLDYIDMLKVQLNEKLDELQQEELVIDSLLEELEEEARRNKLENILNNMPQKEMVEENEIIEENELIEEEGK